MSTHSLISQKQLTAMRKVAESAFNTDVQIWRRGSADNAYEDDVETWTYRETIKGWIYSTPTSSASVEGGVIGTLNLYRLFIPVGSAVSPGDKLKISGNFFLVIDTIDESTWLPLLRCSLRRLE
jgi:hypothetical protein